MSWFSDRIGINLDINKAADRAIGGPLNALYDATRPKKDPTAPDVTPQNQLIDAIDQDTKKAQEEKNRITQMALLQSQSRLLRERLPGMGTKNNTIKTGPMGALPTSMFLPKKGLTGL